MIYEDTLKLLHYIYEYTWQNLLKYFFVLLYFLTSGKMLA